MLKDTKRPNGTIKRVQFCRAQRGGISSMGTPFKKGQAILHLSSSRCTGETFILTKADLRGLNLDRPGKWASPTIWQKKRREEWQARWAARV